MFRYLISVPRSEVTQFLRNRLMLLVYARASRNMSVGYICCQSGVKIQKLSVQRENLFRGFVLVGARHSNPHWVARRPNAECPTVGDQSLSLWGQILGSKLRGYVQPVLRLLPFFFHICSASLPWQTQHVSYIPYRVCQYSLFIHSNPGWRFSAIGY